MVRKYMPTVYVIHITNIISYLNPFFSQLINVVVF